MTLMSFLLVRLLPFLALVARIMTGITLTLERAPGFGQGGPVKVRYLLHSAGSLT